MANPHNLIYYSVCIFFLLSEFKNEELTFLNSRSRKPKPRAYVIMAADFETPASIANYGILTPLTSYVWSRVMNVTPVVMLGTREPGRITTAAEAVFASLIRQIGGRVHCISISKSEDNGAGASLAPELVGSTLITSLQVSRLASIALGYLNEDDVILTSDADIWPMSTVFWKRQLLTLLDPANEQTLIYNGQFFRSQRQNKDCNFVALTSVVTKTRIWRDFVLVWLDSRQYAPSPRDISCIYPSSGDNPFLPWYSQSELQNFHNNSDHKKIGSEISFPDLLRIFLKEGRNYYGHRWEKEILYTGKSYKLTKIWNYDQVLMAEIVLASSSTLNVNDDLRRLDKFGNKNDEAHFKKHVSEKTVEDFTDAHLDSVQYETWWRFQAIWFLIFGDAAVDEFSEARIFFQDVFDFSEILAVSTDDKVRESLFFPDAKDLEEALGRCDNV